jgi:hypothetical protein
MTPTVRFPLGLPIFSLVFNEAIIN